MVRINGSDGITVLGDKEYITTNNKIKIQYYLTNSDPYGTVSVEICGIKNGSSDAVLSTIYCTSEEGKDYSSAVSLDCLSDCSLKIKQLLEKYDKAGESGSVTHTKHRLNNGSK